MNDIDKKIHDFFTRHADEQMELFNSLDDKGQFKFIKCYRYSYMALRRHLLKNDKNGDFTVAYRSKI
jgi:hypothetical protein